MSTILVDNLTGKTSAGDITVTSEGGAATQSLQQGLAKAWANFNGTGTISFYDSFNCGSLTDNGSGDHFVNYINNMSSSSYARLWTAGQSGFGANPDTIDHSEGTSSQNRVQCRRNDNNSNADCNDVNFAGLGDLA